MLKKNPSQSKNMLLYANNFIKYMPINKSSMDMLSPIFDFTSTNNNKTFMEKLNHNINPMYNPILRNQPTQINQMIKPTKRSVSETKKKYVASNQDWKCAQCKNKLTHTFEIDHRTRLELGGSNDVSNLIAMCRECHGQKTAFENM
jgi:5-methylcytosine-specific restriction endonuclease McrA